MSSAGSRPASPPEPRMRVLQVAPPFSPVPPDGYGGIERTVNDLVRAQQASGLVEPSLVAPADSTIAARLVTLGPSLRSRGIELSEANREALLSPWARLVVDAAADVDVVHLHGTWLLPFLADLEAPVVLSVYTDTADSAVRADLASAPPGFALVANSRRTRDKAPDLPWFDVVLEGLDLAGYPFDADLPSDTDLDTHPRASRLVFVGELIPAKGAHRAIRVARSTGRGLDLIGRTTRLDVPLHEQDQQRAYLETHVLPHVDGTRIRLHGELGTERLRYIQSACGLLSPIDWEEPFGRVLIEAMACGTPVIAMRRGAVPEVVDHGVSGLIVDDVDGMIAAVDRLGQLSPHACRDHVARRFSASRVARDYLRVYQKLIAKGTRIARGKTT